jgi:transposase
MDANELLKEVEKLRSQLKTAQIRITELSSTVSEQQAKREQKERQGLALLKSLKGKQRERLDPNQLLLFALGNLEQLIEETLAEDQPAQRRKRKPHGRRLIPDGLPQEVIEYTLPEAERQCPHDGGTLELIRWEESKQLDYVPAKLKVIVHRRAVYAFRKKHDETKLVTAPKPPQPIDKGLAAAGLLAHVVVSKFGDHLPGYRLEDIFSRHGVEIRRGTIYQWLAALAELCRRLYRLLKRRVLESRIIHTDDTTVRMLEPPLRDSQTARFWAYLGDNRQRYVVYDFTRDRSRDGPKRFLEGFAGYLQADACSAYDGIYLGSAGKIIEVACWAHCRRKWYDARESGPQPAHEALAFITRLYEVERAMADSEPQVRVAARREHARPLLDQFRSWLGSQTFLPKSPLGQAATYTHNQWDALCRYLDDGELSIDNNRAERAMRPLAIGRKN